MPTTKKTKQETSNDEIIKDLAEIKRMLSERKHLDEVILDIKHELEGNGKPGWKAIRDKVSSWEIKVNAIMLAVLGDVVFRIVVVAISYKP